MWYSLVSGKLFGLSVFAPGIGTPIIGVYLVFLVFCTDLEVGTDLYIPIYTIRI